MINEEFLVLCDNAFVITFITIVMLSLASYLYRVSTVLKLDIELYQFMLCGAVCVVCLRHA